MSIPATASQLILREPLVTSRDHSPTLVLKLSTNIQRRPNGRSRTHSHYMPVPLTSSTLLSPLVIDQAYVSCCKLHSIALTLPRLAEDSHTRENANHRPTLRIHLANLKSIPHPDDSVPNKLENFTKSTIAHALDSNFLSLSEIVCCQQHAASLQIHFSDAPIPRLQHDRSISFVIPAATHRPIHIPLKQYGPPSTPKFRLPRPYAILAVPNRLTRTRSSTRRPADSQTHLTAPSPSDSKGPPPPPSDPPSPGKALQPQAESKSEAPRSSGQLVRGTAKSTIPGSRRSARINNQSPAANAPSTVHASQPPAPAV